MVAGVAAVAISSLTDLLAIASADDASGPVSKRLALEPTQLRLKRFEIPFSVDAVGQRPTDVQLFVSRDGGKQWSLFATQPPAGKTFLFDAKEDGEHWFATRTIDGTGKAYPEGPIVPQLFVRIDTTDPHIDLHAELTADSSVSLDVRCVDQWPNRESLRVEYMTDTNSTWSSVAEFGSAVKSSAADCLEGSVRFAPAGDWHQLSIRAIAKDLAGNQTITTHQLQKPRIATAPGQFASTPLPQSGSLPVDHASQMNPYALKALQSFNQPLPGNAFPSSIGQGSIATVDAPPTFASTAAENLPTPQPDAMFSGSDNGQPTLIAPNQSQSTAGPELLPTPQRRAATPAEALRPIRKEEINRPAPDRSPNSAPTQSSARPSLGSVESLPRTLADTPQPPLNGSTLNGSTLNGSTTSSPIRHSRSRKFSLDYEVESAGRAGVEEVELWGSADRGQTWKRWGADPDRQTPFDIETNNDGVYGFCIVVVAKNGLATARPIAESAPDIFVVVDTLKPVMRISAATYGEADQTGSLLVRYECNDENLSTRPITLAFSNSPQGPWTTIAAGLENNGGYVWPADPQLPRQIYLRLDAVDLAGNSGSYVLESPIDVQGLAPRARIRGFNPITGTLPATDPTPQTAAGPTARFK